MDQHQHRHVGHVHLQHNRHGHGLHHPHPQHNHENRKLYRRIFSIERFIRQLTRSISTSMCDTATSGGGPASVAVDMVGSPMVAAVAAAAAVAADQQQTSSSMASAMLAKRERRLRLEKVGSYRVGRTLGRGNFAKVRIAYHDVANAKVAMKIVDKHSLDAENLAKIEREIQILQQLNHPHIVRLYEVIRTERYLYIVTEYVSNGELFDMLMDRGRQTESDSRRLFQQIVSAVAYCHAHGIVHRDLKAENLLLDKRGNIKIIDFGFSNHQQPGQLLSTWCGSPPYAAPELLLAQEYDGRQSDVWSLGVILYILVTAGFPFPGDSVDKLKRAVLSDHLKIPFWVSVECADLIRKMLTVQPAKRCTLHYVIQHKWFTCKMPEPIKQLLASSAAATSDCNNVVAGIANNIGNNINNNVVGRAQQQLDPTVLVFMQQHTGWSDEQIAEEVLSRNYESPVFGTYELLLSRLSEFRDAEAAATLLSNAQGSNSNLQLDAEHARRGSRGSIISGRANVEPGEQQHAATIPAHHLAKLNLSTSPDYQDSDDSDSASDMGAGPGDEVSPRYPAATAAQQSPATTSSYKSTRHRAYRRARAQATADVLLAERQSQQRLTFALEQCHQLNPLLNAAAQQFAVDTTRWANAAAAAALFASQLQQHNSTGSAAATQQQLQQAAALNLVSLQNFPFVDYARMMHVPNQERRASANEALLGLNSYAHLLAACSTIGMGGTSADPTRCSSSQGTTNTTASSSPRQRTSYHAPPTSAQTQHGRRSVEEEGEFYLSGQRGSAKRNTVHSITGGLSLLGASSAASPSSAAFLAQQSRHSRMPYAKQVSAGDGGERRSSWASSSAAAAAAAGGSTGSAAAALAINAQQQAQLERLYRQSIGQANSGNGGAGGSSDSPSASLSSLQQLQLEFQKLCANTKETSPTSGSNGGGVAAAGPRPAAGVAPNFSLNPATLLFDSVAAQPQMPRAPTISITDENNRNLESGYEAQQQQQQQQFISALLAQQQQASADGQPQFSQSLPRPATVCGFASPDAQPAQQIAAQPAKFLYIPVSIPTALARLQRVVETHKLLCELQTDDEPGTSAENVSSIRIRVAPAAAASSEPATILELALHRMDQSPNISRACFAHVQGDAGEHERMRQAMLNAFNEVL